MARLISPLCPLSAYDGDGKLVKAVEDGVTTLYVGAHYQVSGEVVTQYYFAGTQRIAMRTNGVLNYLLADHLGSTGVVTDTAGTVIAETRYTRYGETRFASGTSPTDYLYTSQRQEAGLGLYFYNARWFDPSLARFIQADTIVPGAGNPQAFDRYAYVLGNPLRYSDPSGHSCYDNGNYIPDPSACDWIRQGNTPPPEPPLYPDYAEETRYQDDNAASQISNSFVKSEGGRLFGPPGGPTEKDPDLPMTEYNQVEAQAQAVVLAIDIFADYTYYVHPNFQSPSWYGNSFYEPIDEINPGWSVPGIQPATSDLWYSVKGVQVYNHSYEPIFVSYIRTSQGGDKFNYKNSTQVLPFAKAAYTIPNYNKVDSHAYSNVFSINNNNIVFPGESYFIQIGVVSISQRAGEVIIRIP